jgi:hypothetical protein
MKSQVMRCLILLSGLALKVSGHGALVYPLSRNIWRYEQGLLGSYYEATALNSNKIRPAWMACGDPWQDGASDSLVYTTANSDWDVFGLYSAGDVITVEYDLTVHHEGYLEFKLCDVGPEGTVTQECFDEYPLLRVEDGTSTPFTPVDDNYPGRYYFGKNCGAGSNFSTGMKLVDVMLPSDITCDHCVLQVTFVTQNSCWNEGVQDYSLANPNPCGSSQYGSLPSCAQVPSYEQFWNCADISIDGTVGPTPGPTDEPTPAPTDGPPPEPTSTPTLAPMPECTPCAGKGGCIWSAAPDACYADWSQALCESFDGYFWCGPQDAVPVTPDICDACSSSGCVWDAAPAACYPWDQGTCERTSLENNGEYIWCP